MGKVVTPVRLTNSFDAHDAERGLVPASEVRRVEIQALVDTGAAELAIPQEVATALGLPMIDRRKVRYADGRIDEVPYIGGLVIEILGRHFVSSAFVLPAGATPLLGLIPLEALDLVVNPRTQEVSVNPASPDIPLLDLLRVA